MNFKNITGLFVLAIGIAMLVACEAEEPTREDTPEMITKAIFVFTSDLDTVTLFASDPDGDGVKSMQANDTARLQTNREYELSITLLNEFASPGSDDYTISEEVNKEGDEHMFFFGWTGNVFANPQGDGNIDSRSNTVGYLDTDENGLPLGLKTSFTTSEDGFGSLRVILKHQPDGIKTTDSQSSEGETDLDVTFYIAVE